MKISKGKRSLDTGYSKNVYGLRIYVAIGIEHFNAKTESPDLFCEDQKSTYRCSIRSREST